MACVEGTTGADLAPMTPLKSGEKELEEEQDQSSSLQAQPDSVRADNELSNKSRLQKQLAALMVILKMPGVKLAQLSQQLQVCLQDQLSERPGLQKQLAALTVLLRVPGSRFTELFEWLKARYSATTLFLLGSVLAQTAASWCSGLPIMAIERYAPQLIARYKIQPNKIQPTRRVLEMLLDVGGTQLAGAAVAVIVQKLKIPAVDRVAERSVSAPLPSFPRVLGELAVNLLSWEVVFYTMHRLFHTQKLYRQVHKKHHTFKAPVALASAYATNVEHVFGDLFPGMVGSALLHIFANSSVVNIWAWAAFGSVLTNINHSGYYFPWFPFRECTMMHDYHHYSFYSQLGLFGWMDRLFGTDGGADYVKWRAENLRRILGRSA
mmetsp:Transcript_90667/g.228540  ORF Transcript_90667/g.228540 Transcript_90667/m.228540 type:complete len:379 (+) Transcript_90667:79-1215(+)